MPWRDDTGINGELDDFADASNFNTISYLYDADSFRIGLGVDDLSGAYNGVDADTDLPLT
jgi:hypothetical protein